MAGSESSASTTVRHSYTSARKPTWCPGCGDFGVLGALDRALGQLGRPEHQIAIVSGIGCSSRFPFFMNTYGFHSAHGRGLTVATGLKVARPDLTVVATGGDGDALAIGGNHFLHAMRRNLDLTYILMDNQIYGMTKGQTGPTSRKGLCSKSTPYGNPDNPIDATWLALSTGAGFVAQAGSWNMKQLTQLILLGIRYPGMAFINVLSPCVTFHKEATRDYFKHNALPVPEDHDPTSYDAALGLLLKHRGRFPTGVIYQASTAEPDRPSGPAPKGQRELDLVESVLAQYR